MIFETWGHEAYAMSSLAAVALHKLQFMLILDTQFGLIRSEIIQNICNQKKWPKGNEWLGRIESKMNYLRFKLKKYTNVDWLSDSTFRLCFAYYNSISWQQQIEADNNKCFCSSSSTVPMSFNHHMRKIHVFTKREKKISICGKDGQNKNWAHLLIKWSNQSSSQPISQRITLNTIDCVHFILHVVSAWTVPLLVRYRLMVYNCAFSDCFYLIHGF